MLPVPKDLNIVRDFEAEQELLDKSRKFLTREERTGVHMSDLIDPRLAYFKRINPAPLPDRLINTFIVGQLAHAIILAIKGDEQEYNALADQGTRLFQDIKYSPDFMDYNECPDEIKTTRSFYLPKAPYLPDDSTYHMYFEQLLGYMACEDKTEGRLTVLYLNSKDDKGKTAPSFYIWKITTTPKILERYREILLRTKEVLEKALETKDHTILPNCRAWKCRECEYWNNCQPEGRYGLPEKEWADR